ncbi:MAG: TIGR04282 family arsenosugar biosynthesis glycosyltransferase [Ginsengibacter sp.]
MKNALIIFVRKPELGKVKTRLAADIGDENALKVYNDLLTHTCVITKGLPLDKYAFYSEKVTGEDLWNKNGFYRKIQNGNNLGEKMENAFKVLFNESYEKLIIIGSDCFELDESLISKAFKQLDNYDVVIGPANDGGYYLLGMKKIHPFLFRNKKWSTDSVFSDTLQDIQEHTLSCFRLPVLTDVDTEEDYIKTRKD